MTKQYTAPALDIDEGMKATRYSFHGETFTDPQTKTPSDRLLYRREFKSTEGKEIPSPAGVWVTDVLSSEEMIAFDEMIAKLDEAALSAPEFKDKA